MFVVRLFERKLTGALVILPLWQPSPDVQLGAVGYLEKPTGRFVTLFNAFKPVRSSVRQVQTMPSIDGYGKVTEGNQKQDKLNIIQRGMDSVVGFISRNKSDGSIPYVSNSWSVPFRRTDVNGIVAFDGVTRSICVLDIRPRICTPSLRTIVIWTSSMRRRCGLRGTLTLS